MRPAASIIRTFLTEQARHDDTLPKKMGLSRAAGAPAQALKFNPNQKGEQLLHLQKSGGSL